MFVILGHSKSSENVQCGNKSEWSDQHPGWKKIKKKQSK